MATEIGTRVHVFSADQSQDLGFGTITKVEPFIDEETGEVLIEDYASEITLDSGEITQGMECWWHPI